MSVTFEKEGGVILECMSILLFETEWISYEIVANSLKQIALFKIINGFSLYFSVQWHLTWHLATCDQRRSHYLVSQAVWYNWVPVEYKYWLPDVLLCVITVN